MNHTTPSDTIFNEIKEAAIKIWKTYDNTYGYVDEKLDRINSIENYQDNAMVFIRMFDGHNQNIMMNELSDEAREYILNNN